MKAEPDPHHVDVVKPSEERPEVKVARAVEALSEPAAEHVVPEAVAATKLPQIAKAASPEKPAAASAGESAAVSVEEPAPVVPEPGEARAAAGNGAHGVPASAEGAEREPERVGKSGAQADGDDIV
jgi:membrane protein